MKTFKDLEFTPHGCVPGGKQARIEDFGNGYGVSVVGGGNGLRGNGETSFEVAVLFDDSLCYDSGITDDVENWQSVAEVTELMRRIQELPPRAVSATA